MPIRSENPIPYNVVLDNAHDQIISQAISILRARLTKSGAAISNSKDTTNYLKLKLAGLEHEVFCVMLLDNQRCVIEFKELFRGTIDGAAIHPREVVKLVLQHNAAAVIFAHNHPSGEPQPSSADENVTRRLRDALATIDVQVLDHIIVGGNNTASFAERGLI